jgi:hypothetical protein
MHAFLEGVANDTRRILNAHAQTVPHRFGLGAAAAPPQAGFGSFGTSAFGAGVCTLCSLLIHSMCDVFLLRHLLLYT